MKKLLALALTLALMVSLCPVTLAVSTLKASEATTEVEKKLANLQTQSGYRPGDKGTGECMAFAKKVFKQLFGYDTNTLFYHGTLEGASPNLVRVGRCFVAHAKCSYKSESGDQTTITADTVKALLSQAKCGDIVQTTKFDTQKVFACPVGRPHTMVVQQVKSDSIVVYEGNYTPDTVGVREITFKSFASSYTHTITVYRANNYDKVNGSSSSSTTVTTNEPSTLKISPTTQPTKQLKGDPFYFKGKITSNYPIISATVTLSDTSGNVLQTKTIQPNTTSVDIATSGLDALKFGALSAGMHIFRLKATDQSGCSDEWSTVFVVSEGTGSPINNVSITSDKQVYQIGDTITFTCTHSSGTDIGTFAIYGANDYFKNSSCGKWNGDVFTTTAKDIGHFTATVGITNGRETVEQSCTYQVIATPETYRVTFHTFIDGVPSPYGDDTLDIKAGTSFTHHLGGTSVPTKVTMDSGTWDKGYKLQFTNVSSDIDVYLYYETPEEETPVPTSTPTSAPTPSSKPEPTSKPTATAQPTSEPSTAPAPTTAPKPTSTGSSSNFHSVNTYYSGTFYDVSTADWFDENVSRAYELGLMKGMSDTSFGPYSNVTVAQAVTLAARLHSIYYTGSENFVQSGKNWYDVYVSYARDNGILQDVYNYDYPISRGDFAHILANAFPSEALPVIDSDIYFDDVKSSTPYKSDIYLLAQAGIIRGAPNVFGTLDFSPGNGITRAEVAAIVTRMADPSLR